MVYSDADGVSPGVSDLGITAFSRRVRPWFIFVIVLEVTLLIVRWHLGDKHGTLLMCAVAAVGVIAIVMGGSGVDPIYGGYFGLMSFVSGILDLNLAIEYIAWHEWMWHRQRPANAGDEDRRRKAMELAMIARPALYLLCASVQLSAATIAYLIYKDFEQFEEGSTDPIFATAEQARIYNAALSHAERRVLPQSVHGLAAPRDKSFTGTPHKLP
jgi:hypothetical protein